MRRASVRAQREDESATRLAIEPIDTTFSFKNKAYAALKSVIVSMDIYRNRSDIFALKGDKESAKKTLEEAIRYAEALPKEQQSASVIGAMKKKLETM